MPFKFTCYQTVPFYLARCHIEPLLNMTHCQSESFYIVIKLFISLVVKLCPFYLARIQTLSIYSKANSVFLSSRLSNWFFWLTDNQTNRFLKILLVAKLCLFILPVNWTFFLPTLKLCPIFHIRRQILSFSSSFLSIYAFFQSYSLTNYLFILPVL